MKEKTESDKHAMPLEESSGEKFTNILEDWDSDDETCSGKNAAETCKRISKFVLFLICFFGLLVMFSVGAMILFNRIFNGKEHEEEEPIVHTEEPELIFEVPGLIFEPQSSDDNGVIHCSDGSHVTRPYIKRMNSFIKNLNPMSHNSQDCDETLTRNGDRPCRFNMSQLGNVCVKKRKYGFDDCRLCVALTLDKVFDWQPIAYENESVPLEIRDRYRDNAVTVSCNGEQQSDKENMGPVAYYPPEGFHFKYFPYLGQEGYNTPLVMVHFKNPVKFVFISIECKVWAKNFDHSKNEGITNFQMYLKD